MTKRIGINGFGRIGRLAYRVASQFPDLEVVAINDLGTKDVMVHLLKYDSVHGRFGGVATSEKGFTHNGREVQLLSEKDPAALPWGALGVDVVIESTGAFTSTEKAGLHLKGGAKKVVISAPASGDPLPPTIVYGINNSAYDPAKHDIISAASCTTNCLAPFAKVLNDTFGIEHGQMLTVHAYTNDQQILDLPHKDLRRARAAAINMIPTTTGAAKAVGLVLPELKGKLDGYAMRVPTADVSFVDLTVKLKTATTAEAINAALKAASEGPLKGILGYTDEELVSMDFLGITEASYVDSKLTKVIDGTLAKVGAWYDNEYGFTNQLIRLVRTM
jgi:glyceraldehyde 3-phosphate dehydrogenase